MVLETVCEKIGSFIHRLNFKKTCDSNGLSVWLFEQCRRHLLRPLTKQINLSFESGHFPSILKKAKIVLIVKKDYPCLESNYCPIYIPLTLSKVFENYFYDKLNQLSTMIGQQKHTELGTFWL